jgi:hypothetical protein
MLAFKHKAGGFGTLGTLALEAETSGGGPISLHTTIEAAEKARLRWPEIDRQVLSLRVKGLSFYEIWRQTPFSQSTVRRSFHRLIKAGKVAPNVHMGGRHWALIPKVKQLRLIAVCNGIEPSLCRGSDATVIVHHYVAHPRARPMLGGVGQLHRLPL